MNWNKICILTFAILIVALIVFYVGHSLGVRHVLNDSEFWVTRFEEPNEEYDYEFYIHLDGKTYARYGYIG